MNSSECIFCKIARREIPTTLIYEDAEVVAFHDIHPKAPVHVLIVPTQHIETVADASDDDQLLLGRCLLVARDVAHQLDLDGFKLHVNNGAAYGQSVPHLHLHLLSGQFQPGALQSL